jgi:methionine-rich copper-binding protein CopC
MTPQPLFHMARRLGHVVLLALVALAFGAGPSGAHSTLESASPGPGDSVSGVIDRVELKLSVPYVVGDEGDSNIFIFGPAPEPGADLGDATAHPLAPGRTDRVLITGSVDEVDDLTVALDFAPLLTSGEYQVTWQVVSADDGYLARNAYRFSYDNVLPRTDIDLAAGADGGVPLLGFGLGVLAIGVLVAVALGVTRGRRPSTP